MIARYVIRPLRQKRRNVQSLTMRASALDRGGCHTPYICPDARDANRGPRAPRREIGTKRRADRVHAAFGAGIGRFRGLNRSNSSPWATIFRARSRSKSVYTELLRLGGRDQ